MLAIILSTAAACRVEDKAPAASSRNDAREKMVREQLVARNIQDPRVLTAMREVPREEFVPDTVRKEAYQDRPLSIGYGQTISQPYVVGFMTEQLHLRSTDRVLEIGTGSGYQTALLARLAAHVFSIEIVEPLAQDAAAVLTRLHFQNVTVKAGDGYAGWPEHAPFDAVIVTCAPEDIPKPLIEQLKEGGRMIIPVGEFGGVQELYFLKKVNGEILRTAVLPVRFVPMTRGAGGKEELRNKN